MISKISPILDRGFREPTERKALSNIRNAVVLPVSNLRDEIALPSAHRCRWAVFRGAGKNTNANLKTRHGINLLEHAPAFLSCGKHLGGIGHNLKRKAQRVVYHVSGQVKIPEQRIVWKGVQLHPAPSNCAL